MTNREQIQKRIERDKARKAAKRAARNKDYNDLDEIFTLEHHRDAVKVCQNGVMWKATAQKYCKYQDFNAVDVLDTYGNGNIIPLRQMKKEVIRERGKAREITPIMFDDRVPQRMICDNSLVPVMQNVLINNNCASIPNKGVAFARNTIDKYLRKSVKEWGEDFYVLTTDFKDFFGSIPHSACKQALDKIYENPEIIDLIMKVIKSYHQAEIRHNKLLSAEEKQSQLQAINNLEGRGICLGSQVSQMMALLVPNKFDHFIKDKYGIKRYIRYMDDCIIIHNDKEVLWDLYRGMKEVAESLGLKFNDRKTKLVKITKGFVFLKVHYRLANGKIIRTLDRSTKVRQRRKLKKFRHLVDESRMTYDDVYNSMQAWLSHNGYATNSYHTTKNMLKLYDELFDGYKITNHYFKEHPRTGGKPKNEILQSRKWTDIRRDWNDREFKDLAA